MASNQHLFPEPPPGHQAHQESTTQILIKTSSSADHPSEAFINPVQEYNRDLSITVIRAWSKLRNQELESRRSKKSHKRHNANNDLIIKRDRDHFSDESCDQKKKLKPSEPDQLPQADLPTAPSSTEAESTPTLNHQSTSHSNPPDQSVLEPQEPAHKFTALEALSATGLRAIRYAKEIPALKWIIANDLSPSAIKAINANITHNGLDPKEPDQDRKVRVNQGDACDLMYAHRAQNCQFDIVDLDPYGSAAPFMDAAVQCIRDGGLLCVTCTDLAVLAGSAYPEKCFSNYGGSSMRAEYSHEYALRQVIHALASSAARYGKQIKPLLSLSIDFYVRIFVRVFNSPAEVKKFITNTALVYVCASCSAHHFQALGRSTAKPTKSGHGSNVSYHHSLGPPISGSLCEECGGKFHVAGPIWNGDLHDQDFADLVLKEADLTQNPLKTAERIKGMVGIAKTELPHAPFFFTPAKLSGLFKCTSPSLVSVGSALLNGGYEISRSHCQPGSIKTNAPRAFIYDMMRKWVESNQPDGQKKSVNPSEDPPAGPKDHNTGENQTNSDLPKPNRQGLGPTALLLSKPLRYEIDFRYNKLVETSLMTNLKIVRYQSNPTPNWGPKSRASKR